MSIDSATAPPARVTICNLLTQEEVEVQFNPEKLEEEVSINWAKLHIPGHGHQLQQFVNTNNHGVALELYYRATNEEEMKRLEETRKFLLSLCYPSEAAGDVVSGAPARVLFVWPNLFAFTCYVQKVKLVHVSFAQDGRPTRFNATLELEEVRDGRLTSEEVRANGTRRSSE